MVLFYLLLPVVKFVFGLVLRTPGHVKNSFFLTHKTLWVAVAFKTPLHLQRLGLVDHRHLIDAPVGGRTGDAFNYVNAVNEINVVRQIKHANPIQRFAGLKTRAYWFEIRSVGPDLLMTIHADRRRRNARR